MRHFLTIIALLASLLVFSSFAFAVAKFPSKFPLQSGSGQVYVSVFIVGNHLNLEKRENVTPDLTVDEMAEKIASEMQDRLPELKVIAAPFKGNLTPADNTAQVIIQAEPHYILVDGKQRLMFTLIPTVTPFEDYPVIATKVYLFDHAASFEYAYSSLFESVTRKISQRLDAFEYQPSKKLEK